MWQVGAGGCSFYSVFHTSFNRRFHSTPTSTILFRFAYRGIFQRPHYSTPTLSFQRRTPSVTTLRTDISRKPSTVYRSATSKYLLRGETFIVKPTYTPPATRTRFRATVIRDEIAGGNFNGTMWALKNVRHVFKEVKNRVPSVYQIYGQV